ncbi:DNA polymerase III subunit delta [Lebetimonas sp. JH292]|uniref:DNA polymerase III subunit delta n=1 Tax=Lebetimonas sp. JH292 TaxID=990068 RepID=UPI000465CC37|nr:DNA polymerase III subunit delta [Lebetimonas sp. JH292]
MNKKEFDLLKEIPNFVVFYGNEFYLEMYQKKLEEKFKNENILKLYFDEFDKNTAKTHLLENSLFGGKNILIVKTNKWNKEIEELKKYSKNNYCFIFYTGNKKIKLSKNDFVRFFSPSYKEIIEYINLLSKKENVLLSNEAKNFLAKSIEPLFLAQEIKKLASFKNEISLNDVTDLVFLYKEESFEDLFVKILSGADFFDDLKSILETADFKRIIPALVNYITNLYQYNLYIKKTGSSNLKNFLGYQLPFDIEKNRVNIAIKLKENDYKKLLDYLLNKELSIRNSDKEKEALFWEAMIWLKNYHSF